MSEKELIECIQEEIQHIPCFYCIDGFLKLKGIEFRNVINAKVYCETCDTTDEMKFDL